MVGLDEWMDVWVSERMDGWRGWLDVWLVGCVRL